VRIAAFAILAIILGHGFIQTKMRINSRRQKDFANEKRVAEELGTIQRPDLRTVLVKAGMISPDLHFISFYLFHGNLRQPLERHTVEEIRHSPPPPPLLGVCVTRDFPVIQAIYPEVKVQFTRAQFILWKVDDLKTGGPSSATRLRTVVTELRQPRT